MSSAKPTRLRSSTSAFTIDPRAEHSTAVAPTCGARVSLPTTTGRTVVGRVSAPRGPTERGIEWSDVEAKYCTLLALADVDHSAIESSLALIQRLDRLGQVSDLTSSLAY
jgi:hypothetical protein